MCKEVFCFDTHEQWLFWEKVTADNIGIHERLNFGREQNKTGKLENNFRS